jgi:hypothetical protein
MKVEHMDVGGGGGGGIGNCVIRNISYCGPK